MGFCSCTVKYLLFLFNFLCALAGLAVLIVGIIGMTKSGTFTDIDGGGKIHTSAIFLIIVGGIVFVIAFFGCCGAIREDTCMITFYAIILLTLLVIEVAISVYVLYVKKDVANDVKKGFDNLFNTYNDNDKNKQIVDSIQKSLECCGLQGPYDWTKSSVAPGSCCKQDTHGASCPYNQCFKDGCEKKIDHIIDEVGKTIGWVALSLVIVELLGVISAFCLSSSIKRADRRSYA